MFGSNSNLLKEFKALQECTQKRMDDLFDLISSLQEDNNKLHNEIERYRKALESLQTQCTEIEKKSNDQKRLLDTKEIAQRKEMQYVIERISALEQNMHSDPLEPISVDKVDSPEEPSRDISAEPSKDQANLSVNIPIPIDSTTEKGQELTYIFSFSPCKWFDGYSVKKYIGFSEETITIPTHYKGKPVVEIGEKCFEGCKDIKRIHLSNSIRIIWDHAFSGVSNLKEVTGCQNLLYIGNNAFEECTSLSAINLVDSVSFIGKSCFANTAIETFRVPKNLHFLSFALFRGCKSLSNITLHDTVIAIGGSCFQECASLSSVIIPPSVIEIGQGAFLDCVKLEQVSTYAMNTLLAKDIFSVSYVWQPDRRYNPVIKYKKHPTRIIFCLAGSTMQTYCRENELRAKQLTTDKVINCPYVDLRTFEIGKMKDTQNISTAKFTVKDITEIEKQYGTNSLIINNEVPDLRFRPTAYACNWFEEKNIVPRHPRAANAIVTWSVRHMMIGPWFPTLDLY